MEIATFLRVIEGLDVNVRMYAKMTVTGCGFLILLVKEGEIVPSDEKTSTCTCN